MQPSVCTTSGGPFPIVERIRIRRCLWKSTDSPARGTRHQLFRLRDRKGVGSQSSTRAPAPGAVMRAIPDVTYKVVHIVIGCAHIKTAAIDFLIWGWSKRAVPARGPRTSNRTRTRRWSRCGLPGDSCNRCKSCPVAVLVQRANQSTPPHSQSLAPGRRSSACSCPFSPVKPPDCRQTICVATEGWRHRAKIEEPAEGPVARMESERPATAGTCARLAQRCGISDAEEHATSAVSRFSS